MLNVSAWSQDHHGFRKHFFAIEWQLVNKKGTILAAGRSSALCVKKSSDISKLDITANTNENSNSVSRPSKMMIILTINAKTHQS